MRDMLDAKSLDENECNTLRRTATHCNTLQHTATHCNTLQHTATHCNTLQHTATHCNILQHSATLCNTLKHNATYCNTLQHTGNTLQHSATHCNTLQHTATQCNTLQHDDTWHTDACARVRTRVFTCAVAGTMWGWSVCACARMCVCVCAWLSEWVHVYVFLHIESVNRPFLPSLPHTLSLSHTHKLTPTLTHTHGAQTVAGLMTLPFLLAPFYGASTWPYYSVSKPVNTEAEVETFQKKRGSSKVPKNTKTFIPRFSAALCVVLEMS
jgi:hypothetical protein